MPAPRHARRKRLRGRSEAVGNESNRVRFDLCFAAPRYFCEYTKKRAPAPRPLPPRRSRTRVASPVVPSRRPMPFGRGAFVPGVPCPNAPRPSMVAGPPLLDPGQYRDPKRAPSPGGRPPGMEAIGANAPESRGISMRGVSPVRRCSRDVRGRLGMSAMGTALDLILV